MRPEDEGRLRFIALPQHRWAHCHFPRAGSWSARALAADLLGCEYRQPNDQTAEQLAELKAQGWLTSWFVRDPVQRFVSVYRHFARLERRFRAQGIVYAVSWRMRSANSDGRLFESIDTFAERAFNEFAWDKHIAPQTGWGAEIADIQAPLYRAGDAWVLIRNRVSKSLPDLFPRINANVDSQECEVPAIVREFYTNDYAYWQRVCADFHPEDFPARRPDVASEARRQEELVRPNELHEMPHRTLVAQ